jgi:hypothetical protein
MKPAFLSLVLAATLFSGAAPVQQSSAPSDPKPSHDSAFTVHDHAKMNERGEKGMTFSETATAHHFLLKPDGGIIRVAANDPKDSDSIDRIRGISRTSRTPSLPAISTFPCSSTTPFLQEFPT